MTPGISHESSVGTPRANNDWLSHTWRLTRWNLRLARRRLMSKILLAILLVGFLAVIGVVLLSYVVVSSASTTTQVSSCPTPVATSQSGEVGPGSPQPVCTPASSQDQQELRSAQDSTLQFLTFPTILIPVGGYTGFMGIILLCILTGALIGNEYSFGTQRLALSRGVSRAQLLAGQVGALAILALAVAGGMIILGALVGLALGPILGGSIPAIPPTFLLEILGFWLVISLQLFAYALIALLLATLGRSTAAGIAGALGYLLFEIIALPIIAAIGAALIGSTFGSILNNLQSLFLGPNLSGLLNGVSQSPIDLTGGTGGSTLATSVIGPAQGLLVALLYCVLLVGASYWLLRKRDVTH
jgi:ABC-type transport system involved in multi-copper enzyme maturation permease subunit